MKSVGQETEVCRDWTEIDAALFQDRHFPPQRMISEIQKQLAN